MKFNKNVPRENVIQCMYNVMKYLYLKISFYSLIYIIKYKYKNKI